MNSMTTITANRGTSTIKTQNLPLRKISGNETITINRGTGVVKVKDIPSTAKPSLKGQRITVCRGTEVIIL